MGSLHGVVQQVHSPASLHTPRGGWRDWVCVCALFNAPVPPWAMQELAVQQNHRRTAAMTARGMMPIASPGP